MFDTPRSFTFDACLGRGGFGEVYRARMTTHNGLVSEVGVKVLRADVDPHSQAIARLRDEGKLLAALSHPAILRVVDLVMIEDRIGLVMEYVDGVDLAHAFKDPVPMPLSVLLEVIGVVAGALDAAWTAPSPESGLPMRLVHRDIKPANIRISRHGHVKLLDFGIARSDELSREARTATDAIIGSPPYMAPERYLEPDLRAESDVYALGCCLFEGILRERFHQEAGMRRMSSLAVDRSQYATHLERRLQSLPGATDPELLALLRQVLAYKPESRGTAADLAAACDRLRERLGGVSLSRWARERDWPIQRGRGGLFEGRTVDEAPMPTARPAELRGAIVEVESTPTRPAQRVHTEPGPTVPNEGPTMPLGHGKPSEPPVRRPGTPRPPVSRGEDRRSPILIAIPVISAVLGVLLLGVAAITGTALWEASRAAPPRDAPALGAAMPMAKDSPAFVAEPDALLSTVTAPSRPKADPIAPKATVVADLQGYAVWIDGPGGRRPLPSELEPGIYVLSRVAPGGQVAPLGEVTVAAGDVVQVRCRDRLDGCSATVAER